MISRYSKPFIPSPVGINVRCSLNFTVNRQRISTVNAHTGNYQTVPWHFFPLFGSFLCTHSHWLMRVCFVHGGGGHFHPAADGRGRERQRESTSTLEVPDQQRTPAHHIRSRSVSPHREEQGRIRSRQPNIHAQRWGLKNETRTITVFHMNQLYIN